MERKVCIIENCGLIQYAAKLCQFHYSYEMKKNNYKWKQFTEYDYRKRNIKNILEK